MLPCGMTPSQTLPRGPLLTGIWDPGLQVHVLLPAEVSPGSLCLSALGGPSLVLSSLQRHLVSQKQLGKWIEPSQI